MKKTAVIILGVILAIVLLLTIVLIHLERTEWTLRGETTEVSIPLHTDSASLSEIEEQARQEALQRYPDAYLSEITWVAETNADFESLAGGELEFTYCDNLGDAHGFYKSERYAFCRVCVDLKRREITKIETYGNFQLGGESEFEAYPEFEEIREAVHGYCVIALPEACAIENSYVLIRNGMVTTANFTARCADGSMLRINGAIKGRFQARDGVSSLVFVENK